MEGAPDMPPSKVSADFWDRVAERYAAMAIRNPEVYRQTLARIEAHLTRDDRVLEVGCGTGTTAVHLAPKVAGYTATDTSREMIAIAAAKVAGAGLVHVDTHVADPCEASLPRGAFDVVIALNVVHLFPDRRAALEGIADRLREGGLFISKTPCLSGGWYVLAPLLWVLRRAGKAPDVHFLSRRRLEQEICKAGFDIVERIDDPTRFPRRFLVARKK